MDGSSFNASRPIATTVLAITSTSKTISSAGLRATGSWLAIISEAFSRKRLPDHPAQSKSELLVAAREGDLALTSVEQTYSKCRI